MVITGLSILLLSASLVYLVLTAILASGLNTLGAASKYDLDALDHKKESFTIIVAHFNDSEKIPKLIDSLEKQSLQNPFTLCVVDDHSAEAHLEALTLYLEESNLDTLLMRNKGEPGKKQALAQAIETLAPGFIIQLDADVVLDINFLAELVAQKQERQADIILGLVKMQPKKNLSSHFAAFEFLSLQMSGLALTALKKPIMANGAAMAYSSEDWSRFRNIGADWASGDDSFLVQAAAKDKNLKIQAAPKAFVFTEAPHSWQTFFNQRIRWGAKAIAYPSYFAQYVAFSVAFFNLSLVFSLLLALSFSWKSLAMVAFFFLVKMIVDYPLLRRFAKNTGQKKLLNGYVLSAIFYPFYIFLSILFIILPTKKTWKGRVYS